MRATFPIITCDHEDGCDQWTLDWHTALASNWRELMADGWTYDPYAPGGEQFCPEHATNAHPGIDGSCAHSVRYAEHCRDCEAGR